MPSAILRQWLILSMLPTPPRRIDTATIQARLQERGDLVHRRTIQRDLVQLSAIFAIVADEKHKPFGWRWAVESSRPEHLFVSSGSAGAPRVVLRLRVRNGGSCQAVDVLRARDVQFDGASSTVTCSVHDTPSLRRLLLGLADAVEVLAPPALRRDIAALAQHAVRLYGAASVGS